MSSDVADHPLPVNSHAEDPLCVAMLEANPFLSGAVNDPAEGEVNVGAIHEPQFRELTEATEEARRLHTHVGQVVWGEPGIGKSHLLTRFYRWAEENQRAVVVFLHNIQPSPDALPGYVLKCVVQRLVQGRAAGFHGTPLYWLVEKTVERALVEFPPGILGDPGQERTSEGGERECARGNPNIGVAARDAQVAYLRLVDRLVRENPHSGVDARTIYHVFFAFFLGAYRGRYCDGNDQGARLALQWLSGDTLEREEAAELALRVSEDPEKPAALPGKQAVESVLVALAEMAWLRGQSFVLCFDQADNLENDQISALAQFLHPLLDHARNLLVVTAGVQSKLVELVRGGVILRAAWERIAQDERGIRLGRIRAGQALQILKARLTRFLKPFAGSSALGEVGQNDELFPLGSGWFEDRTRELVDCRRGTSFSGLAIVGATSSGVFASWAFEHGSQPGRAMINSPWRQVARRATQQTRNWPGALTIRLPESSTRKSPAARWRRRHCRPTRTILPVWSRSSCDSTFATMRQTFATTALARRGGWSGRNRRNRAVFLVTICFFMVPRRPAACRLARALCS